MVIRLLTGVPIARVMATGSLLTQSRLEQKKGFDTMEGMLELESGRRITWRVCLAVDNSATLLGERHMAHFLQFACGALNVGPRSKDTSLVVGAEERLLWPEPASSRNETYFGLLYRRMHEDTLRAMRREKTLHKVEHGINVAAACACAFLSADHGGVWQPLPAELTI